MNSHPRSTIIFVSGCQGGAGEQKPTENMRNFSQTDDGGGFLNWKRSQATGILNISLTFSQLDNAWACEWKAVSPQLWPSVVHCQRAFFSWLIQWDDPARCNRPALPTALFFGEPVQEQQAGSAEGKGKEGLQTLLTSRNGGGWRRRVLSGCFRAAGEWPDSHVALRPFFLYELNCEK